MKRTHTSIFAVLCSLQGIARVKFCFARYVYQEISQATSSLLSRPCETLSSTRFLITEPQSSILDACEFRGSRLGRDCQLSFELYCKFRIAFKICLFSFKALCGLAPKYCAFAVTAPKLWNSLLLCLHGLHNLHEFKLHLKSNLFKQAFCS